MLSKVTFPHTSLLPGGYNLAYDCMQKHTGGIFSRVGIFFTVTRDTVGFKGLQLHVFVTHDPVGVTNMHVTMHHYNISCKSILLFHLQAVGGAYGSC